MPMWARRKQGGKEDDNNGSNGSSGRNGVRKDEVQDMELDALCPIAAEPETAEDWKTFVCRCRSNAPPFRGLGRC